MTYLIASMEIVNTSLILNFGKNGNKYTVSIYDKETNDLTTNKFNKKEEAYKVFEKLSSWFLLGVYSEAQKRRYLATGTMK